MLHKRGFWFIFSFLLVIIFSLTFTSTVQADTETPPETTPVVEETPIPTEEVLPTEEVTIEPTADPTEVAAVEQTSEPTAEATLTGETTTPEQALVEVLAENDLVLTDENGETIPLASEEASIVAEGADPYFMAGGVYYGYTTTGTCAAVVLPVNCTSVGANAIAAAINAYSTTYAGLATGAIYLEAGTYTETTTLNMSSAPTLTGLIGAGSTLTTINLTTPGTNLVVQNTTMGFTLQGLTINGNIDSDSGSALVDFQSNTGALTMTDVTVKNAHADGDGIEITSQTGNVTMNKVTSSANGDEGAKITTTGNVAITNSEFDLNVGPTSLQITATGTIAMNGVSASDNWGAGARLYSSKGITITNSLFEMNSMSVGNGIGLNILPGSTGPITLTNVLAANNVGTNILIDNTNGAVTMTDIDARYSGNGMGISIDNCTSSSGVCTSTIAGAVKLTNIDVSHNQLSNIVVTASGAITILGLTAYDSNTGTAVVLFNQEAKSAQSVSLSNAVGNGQVYGFLVWSKGNVTLNHIETSSNNSGNGITIDNSYGVGTVTLLNTLGDNFSNSNTARGLAINSKGTITVNQINATYNDQEGVYLDNSGGTGNIILKNAITYNNGFVSGANVYLASKGTVTVTSLEADSGYSYGVWITNEGATSPKAVTLTDMSINYNANDGLVVTSKGAISLTRVSLYNNNTSTFFYGGGYLNNTTGTSSAITINDASSTNSQNGWTVLSNGVITINKIWANSNRDKGLLINNSTSTTSPAVTVKFASVTGNKYRGLQINSKGLITLTSAEVASNNWAENVSGYGAVLDNSLGTGGVSITGTATAKNYFNETQETHGLKINTNGPVSISYIETIGNEGIGLYIIEGGTGTISVSNIVSSYNTNTGIYITGYGSITINNPIVENNETTIAGIFIDNGSGTGGVTIQRYGTVCAPYYTNCSVYNNHNAANTFGVGIDIYTKGNVVLKYIDVFEHPEVGININNATGTGSVSLTGITSSLNDSSAIVINSKGAVTANGITTFTNGGIGLSIDNHNGIGKTVSVSNFNGGYNQSMGLYILSAGTVTLAGIDSNNNYNSSHGLYADNTYGTGSVTLTYSGSNTNLFEYNPGYGVLIYTNGAVIINKTDANYNGAGGIFLNNPNGGSVTMNTVGAYNNFGGNGIYLRNKGSVSLTGLSIYNNLLNQLDIDNRAGTGSVTIVNGYFEESDNASGLFVYSNGAITLTNVSAKYNYVGYGAYLDNSSSSSTPGITVQNSGALMNRFDQSKYGLIIVSKGAVKVTNTSSMTNDQEAIAIDNTAGIGTVTLSNVHGYSYGVHGIYIQTRGAVTGTNVSGDGDSDSSGIYIDNCQYSGSFCTSTGAVTLTTVNGSSSGVGLTVFSGGSIIINNLTVESNYNSVPGDYGFGAYLLNMYSTTNAPISVLKAWVYGNEDSGIYMYSKGNVTLDAITAYFNNSSSGAFAAAVFVDNSYGAGNVVISALKGVSNLSNNYTTGLFVHTNGTITATKITANENSEHGLSLNTDGAAKAITLNTITVKRNSWHGITATATAASTFTAIKAYDNGLYNSTYDGVHVNTNGYNFTIVGSYLSGNGENGLDATVGGATVFVKSSFYFGNGRYGSSDAANINTNGSTLMIS